MIHHHPAVMAARDAHQRNTELLCCLDRLAHSKLASGKCQTFFGVYE
jgi:hypothetical protein